MCGEHGKKEGNLKKLGSLLKVLCLLSARLWFPQQQKYMPQDKILKNAFRAASPRNYPGAPSCRNLDDIKQIVVFFTQCASIESPRFLFPLSPVVLPLRFSNCTGHAQVNPRQHGSACYACGLLNIRSSC
jgi:hypothetical protein